MQLSVRQMRWMHRLLCVALAALFLYIAPRVGGYDGQVLESLAKDRAQLQKKIKGLEGEIEVLRERARVLRGGESPRAKQIRDEEIAKIAREELHMIGQGERIVELRPVGGGPKGAAQ